MVCLAVFLAGASNDMMGKMCGIWYMRPDAESFLGIFMHAVAYGLCACKSLPHACTTLYACIQPTCWHGMLVSLTIRTSTHSHPFHLHPLPAPPHSPAPNPSPCTHPMHPPPIPAPTHHLAPIPAPTPHPCTHPCRFPISTFIGIGLEHSIANMFLLPAALLTGCGGLLTMGDVIVRNIIPVVIGNAIAGSIVVAASYSYQFGKLGGKSTAAFKDKLTKYEAKLEAEGVVLKKSVA